MKTEKLIDICNPKQWKTLSTNELKEKGEYPVYGANGIIGYYDKYNHEEKTVLITCRGATCGNIHISKEKSYINGNAMALDNLNEKKCLKEYLYYFLKQYDMKKIISGSAQPQITAQGLKKVDIKLYDIQTQLKIIKKLDIVQEIIDIRKKQIEHLDELIKSQFVEMFGDPVFNNLNWNELKMSELGRLERGTSKHRPRNAPELLGGIYPLIQTGDVSNSGLYITEYKSTYSELGLKQSKMWSKDTLCITIAANIAQTSILTFDACFPDSVVGFITNGKVNNIFMHYWFEFLQKIIDSQATQVAQKNINLKILNDLDVIVPPIELQNQFSEFVKQIDKQKFEIQKSLGETQKLQESIMNKYFGE